MVEAGSTCETSVNFYQTTRGPRRQPSLKIMKTLLYGECYAATNEQGSWLSGCCKNVGVETHSCGSGGKSSVSGRNRVKNPEVIAGGSNLLHAKRRRLRQMPRTMITLESCRGGLCPENGLPKAMGMRSNQKEEL